MKKIIVRILACFIFDTEKRRRFRKKHLHKKTKQYNIGKHSYYASGLIIESEDTVIGKYCSISYNVVIGASQHPTNWLSTSPIQYANNVLDFPTKHICNIGITSKPCYIGNDVWIGTKAVIMHDITIGDGAIIGSGAVVTHDVPPYAIVVGVPAKILRYRFDEKTIKQLLELKWWNLPEEQVAELPFDDIKACIQQIKKFRKMK